ncbi:L-fucose/L-arabinose isomerase family protein [Ruficoccus sp. ZRK36]|uniref:L-fucose/L-arabinose isomerase family protein n=1 Tax=Ruficoccus sp. ZRK36 TaxID=2866311 RepID=UPI001C72C758|nr:L-fucose/L-arabinose isomerase family protein [Ruficoccus sp. ZRK36]QYY36876.1 L-fucose/L-arabinose isomerase family protein [Ruficoccus sp. ZRK36]
MSATQTTPLPTKVERINPLKARVGLLGIGHHVYWPQFDGLLDEMHRKLGVLKGLLEDNAVEVAEFGMIDNAQVAYDAVPAIKAADIDVLFIDMVTYGTSSTFGVLCREIKVPIVLVALQPLKAMDYPNGTTFMQLCNDDVCSVPEFTGVAVRFGRKAPPFILGHEGDDPAALAEIKQWCGIAKVLHSLRTARLGLMGHVLESMLDMHCDPTAITSAFGAHVTTVEPGDLYKHYTDPDPARVESWKERILAFFDTPDPVSDPLTEKLTEQDLENAAKAGVALEGLIADKNLDGFAYYYEAEPGSELRTLVTNLIVANSLLTGGGFPMCGEFDIKTCVAMMIMDRLDIGGSFAEFHPVDFELDSVLVGHDGPHHINIAAAKPVIRSLKKYHGKPGSGAGVEFQIKEGPITMLSIGQTAEGKFKFVIAEGESARRPIPPTGNTNTHGIFKPDVRTFLKRWCSEGPTHHFALGIGHHADTIIQIAEILGIEYALTTPEN